VLLCLCLFIHSSVQSEPTQTMSPEGASIIDFSGGGGAARVSEMAVWPPQGLLKRPLLIAAHGNGGSGPQEIKGWLALAKHGQVTIVCPSFLSSVHSMYVPLDRDYFRQCIHWIQKNICYDPEQVFMTGFSGGGCAVWYLATAYPTFFRGLYLQSGNFVGQVHDLDLRPWKTKPIHVQWGSKDTPRILDQHQDLKQIIASSDLQNTSFEVVPEGTHTPCQEKVLNWILQQSLNSESPHR
jgi:pimeloyl-ACP methyl ester carboxylesterase